jgi:hypothetical protein
MSEIDNGGPAFPIFADSVPRGGSACWGGMTLRDYFAAKAMQGICAHPETWGCTIEEVGVKAYKQADVMLEARKGGKNE